MGRETKKVGIITLHGYHNYGNKLQNFALQEVLNGLGFITDTLVLNNKETVFNIVKSKIRTILRQSPSKFINLVIERMKHKICNKENQELVRARNDVFKQFSKEHLSEIFFELDRNSTAKINGAYNYFVTGSDQVWKPGSESNMEKYFLTFAQKNKRIAYAASFGCSKLPESYKAKYREWLNGMFRISVREVEGTEIIRELTDINAPVLVDPTLLLSKKQWLSFANKASNRPEEGYVLTYFLGEISADTEQYIQNFAQEKNMKIIRLGDIHDKESFVTGPREFIDYINNADVLFTDSFHGVVFSILLERPFVVYERKSSGATMYSRIETLLDRFDLRHREARNLSGDIFTVNYSHVYEILEVERDRSVRYLREALGVGDEKTHES